MASAPATPDQLRPRVRPSRSGASVVTVTYYRAEVSIARPVAGGAVELDAAECSHLHADRAAADACAKRLARRLQREELAKFTPCACHGATPSRACVEHPEPIVYWAPDTA